MDARQSTPNGVARQFGEYTLLDHMGKGGMASVYRARDNESGRIVAVKVFECDEERPPEEICYLRDREVTMLISVQHPNIVRFFGAGGVDDDYYYAMEFVEDSLLKCMRSGDDFDLVDKVHVLRQAASALAAIHRQGIVHRDIKPGNIMLDRDPNGAIHVKLTDLGIARNVSEADFVREPALGGPTRVSGTAKYLSPEQISREALDGRSDVFSLGVVAYELITGALPFQAQDSEGYLTANAEQEPAPVCQVRPDVPDFLGQMVAKMLVKDREERYDAETLARDLELAQQHLISGAPLVERTNPASLFYELPAEAAEEDRKPTLTEVLSPLCGAAALGIVLVGAVIVAMLWPRSPQVQPADLPGVPLPAPPEPVSATDHLAQVASAADAGLYWHALTLLGGLGQEELSAPEQETLKQLSVRAQEALAEDSYRAALAMLEQDRDVEAEIVLEQMKDFFPDAGQTWRLGADILQRRDRASLDQQWARALAVTYDLVRRRRYKEALEARKRLLKDYGADPDRLATARRAIGDLLDYWAGDVLRGKPQADVIEDFLGIVELHQSICPDRPAAGTIGELRLKLAEIHHVGGNHEIALAEYDRAARVAAPDVAGRAEKAADALRRWMAERPRDAAHVAGELDRGGFRSSLWQKRGGAAGSQQVLEGVLQLRSHAAQTRTVPPEASGEQSVVCVETVRPIHNMGFATGVKLMASATMLQRPGVSRAGIEVAGTNGNVFEFAFDGGCYAIATKSKSASAGSTVRGAFGDEDRVWHTLGLRYDFDARRLGVLLDGEEVRRYPLNLPDFRLRVFLAFSPNAASSCQFKDVFCRPQRRPTVDRLS